MCYKSPGPRCSTHAGTTLTTKQAEFDRAELAFIEYAREEHDEESFQEQSPALLHAMSKAHDEVNAAQFIYDSTPSGQKQLHARIKITDLQGKDSQPYKDRLRIGAEQRAKQLKALGGDEAYPKVYARDLKAGDVLVGTGFTVARSPYRTHGQAKNKVYVEGSYPNSPVKRHQWSTYTQMTVDRDSHEEPVIPSTTYFSPAAPTPRKYSSQETVDKFLSIARNTQGKGRHVEIDDHDMEITDVRPAQVREPGDENKAEIVFEQREKGNPYFRKTYRSMTFDDFQRLLNTASIR